MSDGSGVRLLSSELNEQNERTDVQTYLWICLYFAFYSRTITPRKMQMIYSEGLGLSSPHAWTALLSFSRKLKRNSVASFHRFYRTDAFLTGPHQKLLPQFIVAGDAECSRRIICTHSPTHTANRKFAFRAFPIWSKFPNGPPRAHDKSDLPAGRQLYRSHLCPVGQVFTIISFVHSCRPHRWIYSHDGSWKSCRGREGPAPGPRFFPYGGRNTLGPFQLFFFYDNNSSTSWVLL